MKDTPSNDNERRSAVDSGVRRQIGTEANRRYLRELPIFRLDESVPSNFDDLLRQMERAEQRQQRSDRQG